ncbi:MAG: hypothetical protein ACREJ4_02295 [Candidatus Methylomirabilaceae bacterium]
MIPRFLILVPAAAIVTGLTACAAPQFRPEWGIINAPIEDVWPTVVEVAKQWEFELDTIDSSRHLIRGGKESNTVIGGQVDPSQRFGKATRTQVHVLRASMKPRGEESTVIEVVYTIDKVPDEEASFALINTVRHRLRRGVR